MNDFFSVIFELFLLYNVQKFVKLFESHHNPGSRFCSDDIVDKCDWLNKGQGTEHSWQDSSTDPGNFLDLPRSPDDQLQEYCRCQMRILGHCHWVCQCRLQSWQSCQIWFYRPLLDVVEDLSNINIFIAKCCLHKISWWAHLNLIFKSSWIPNPSLVVLQLI